MRTISIALLATLASFGAHGATVHYDEATGGDIEFDYGSGAGTLVMNLGIGNNTVSGTLTSTGRDVDSDAFQIVVADGLQLDGIHFDYASTYDGGRAAYLFYLDLPSGIQGDPEVVVVTDAPTGSFDFYTDLLPLGPGEYGIGRQGSAIQTDFDYTTDYTYTFAVSGIAVPVPAALWLFGSAAGLLFSMRRRARISP